MQFDNIVIRASAGSGKTFQLSSRYLMLALDGVDPQMIFASTFTKKAAGEILYRVLVRLARAAIDAKGHEELCRSIGETTGTLDRGRIVGMLARLLRNLHTLRVSTLDSFFIQIAEAFSFELKLPTGWGIADDWQGRRFLEEAVRVVFARMETGTAIDLMSKLSKGVVARSVTSEILDIAGKLIEIYRDAPPDAWEKLPWQPVLTEEQLDQIAEKYRDAPLPNQNKTTVEAHEKECGLISERDWDALIGKGGFVKKVLAGEYWYRSKSAKIEGPLAESLDAIIDHVFAERINKLIIKTKATRDLLSAIDTAYEEIKRRSKALFFADVPRRLLDGFDEQSRDRFSQDALAYRIDARTRHLLLDEFQDTAPAQWDILRSFVHAALAAPPERERPGSFFCVGDTKQAIYGWRGGSSEIFDTVKHEVHPLKEETLSVSWRSAPVILETVEMIFKDIDTHPRLFGREAAPEYRDAAVDWKNGYTKHEAARPELPGYAVLETSPLRDTEDAGELFALFSQDGRAVNHKPAPAGSHQPAPVGRRDLNSPSSWLAMQDPADADETEGVGEGDEPDAEGEGDGEADSGGDRRQKSVTIAYAVKRIAEIHRRSPHLSIGVLTSKNETVGKIISRLRRLGIEASEEGGNPLTDSAAVEIVLSAMTLADHPGDTVARFHLANSPLGVHLGLRASGSCDGDGGDGVPRFLGRASPDVPTAAPPQSYKDDLRARAAGQAIRESLLREGYGRTVQAWAKRIEPCCDEREMSRLLQLVEKAYQFDSRDEAGLRPGEFVGYIRETRVQNPRSVPVRVMTVHQSKGLEFDVVVLPELETDLTGINQNRPRVVTGRATPTGPIDRVLCYAGMDLQKRLPGAFQTMFREDRRRRIVDSLCKLYVALTRAKHMLVMIVPGTKPAKPTGKDDGKLPECRTFERLLRRVLPGAEAKDVPNAVLFEHGDPDWYARPEAPHPENAAEDRETEPSRPRTLTVALAPLPEKPRRLLRRFAPSAHTGEAGLDVAGSLPEESETDDAAAFLPANNIPEGGEWAPDFSVPQKTDEIGTSRLRGRDRRGALLYGTAVHACFEAVEWLDEHGPNLTELETIVRRIYQTELPPDEAMEETARTVRDFLAMCRRPDVREALAPGACGKSVLRVFRERPFLLPCEDGLMRGSIDRLVVEYDGTGRPIRAEVIDYKTDRTDGTAGRRAREATYQPQLDAYRKAVARLYRLDESQVRTRLLFVNEKSDHSTQGAAR